jgi:hypothetical protein
VLLGGWHQGLDDVDIPLSTVRQQLDLDAVVAEPADVDVVERHTQVVADPLGEPRMGVAREHDDVLHRPLRAFAAVTGTA